MDLIPLYAFLAIVFWGLGMAILLLRHPLRRRHRVRIMVLLVLSCGFLTAAIIQSENLDRTPTSIDK